MVSKLPDYKADVVGKGATHVEHVRLPHKALINAINASVQLESPFSHDILMIWSNDYTRRSIKPK